MARGFRGFRREQSSGKKMCDVLYWVDVNEGYHESVKVGDSVLNPTSFTPTKSGYTFLGWKDSGIASADVFTDKTAEGTSMILFAVFTKTITVTYRNYTVTSTATGTQYYNNSDTLNPSFTLTQTAISAWIARGWTTSASGGASAITYANGATFTRDSNITLYGCYYRTVTVSYNANGGTSGATNPTYGTAYYHSASGATNASVAVSANGYAVGGYTFHTWHLNAPSGAVYAPGSTYVSTADAVMYAEWIVTQTGFGYTGGMQAFVARAGRQYQIQVYGAQGGYGGAGGYSIGYRTPSTDETWYIGVGGAGGGVSKSGLNTYGDYNGIAGGFNGGGNACAQNFSGAPTYQGAGGGATHIGFSNAILAGTSVANLLICAGGGGGASSGSNSSAGGTGGGTNGGGGSNSTGGYNGGGASQSGGGAGVWGRNGGYGAGGSSGVTGMGYNSSSPVCCNGGGGGYYGGGGSAYYGGAGGGSGNTRGTYSAGMANGQRAGHGYVLITVTA